MVTGWLCYWFEFFLFVVWVPLFWLVDFVVLRVVLREFLYFAHFVWVGCFVAVLLCFGYCRLFVFLLVGYYL